MHQTTSYQCANHQTYATPCVGPPKVSLRRISFTMTLTAFFCRLIGRTHPLNCAKASSPRPLRGPRSNAIFCRVVHSRADLFVLPCTATPTSPPCTRCPCRPCPRTDFLEPEKRVGQRSWETDAGIMWAQVRALKACLRANAKGPKCLIKRFHKLSHQPDSFRQFSSFIHSITRRQGLPNCALVSFLGFLWVILTSPNLGRHWGRKFGPKKRLRDTHRHLLGIIWYLVVYFSGTFLINFAASCGSCAFSTYCGPQSRNTYRQPVSWCFSSCN